MKNDNKFLKILAMVSFGILLLGGLNFLLMGLFNFDLLGIIFGTSVVARIIFSIIGLSALTLISLVLFRAFKNDLPTVKISPPNQNKNA
jgi:uncharacterized membrane protein YuzA (DUF378 family)